MHKDYLISFNGLEVLSASFLTFVRTFFGKRCLSSSSSFSL